MFLGEFIGEGVTLMGETSVAWFVPCSTSPCKKIHISLMTQYDAVVESIICTRAKSEAPDNIYSLLKQKVKSCNAKRRRQRERWKNKNRSNYSKKATLHVQHTFFVHFFAVVLHDYNVKLPEVSWLHVLWRKCRTCSCSLFFHCRSFSPSWPLAFLIFSPPLQDFMLFIPQKMSPLFFLSRSISFSRWASLAFRLTFSFSLSFSFSIFQFCGHDN